MTMKRGDRSSVLWCLILASSVGLSSCDWISSLFPASFGPEYRNSETNFIDARNLAAPPPAADLGSAVALDATGTWDWAWRGRAGAGNTFEYMSMTSAGPVGTAAVSGAYTLAADEEAWRLELVNLAGDPYLEGNVGTTPSGWAVDGGGASAAIQAETTTSHGRFMRLSSIQESWAGFDPNVPGFILDAPQSYRTNAYSLSAFSPTATMRYTIGDYAIPDFTDPKSSSLAGQVHTPEIFSASDSNTRFMCALSSTNQTVDLDDLRIVRFDIKDSSRLRLLLRPVDASPTLVAGQYEFSLWIRRPDGALLYADAARTGASARTAPFAASKVMLAMRQIGFVDDRIAPILFQGTFDVGDGWTRVALRMDGGNLDRFDESSAEPVLELSVYPFDPQEIGPGSALIADPRLRFFIDGYTD